jgi:hypothetical protein
MTTDLIFTQCRHYAVQLDQNQMFYTLSATGSIKLQTTANYHTNYPIPALIQNIHTIQQINYK